MVLIGYSGVKEPKPSYFWNAWSACTAERWKMDAVNESERISRMERPVLIEYITDLTTSHSVSAIVNMGKQFSDLKRIGAEDVFYSTMDSLFDKLQLRLHETVGDVDQANEDITSIENLLYNQHLKGFKKCLIEKCRTPEIAEIPEIAAPQTTFHIEDFEFILRRF